MDYNNLRRNPGVCNLSQKVSQELKKSSPQMRYNAVFHTII